jgi:hypothetical protein
VVTARTEVIARTLVIDRTVVTTRTVLIVVQLADVASGIALVQIVDAVNLCHHNFDYPNQLWNGCLSSAFFLP